MNLPFSTSRSVHVIPKEGILVAAQLVEKVVYVDMKALEEEAAVSF